MGAVKLAGLEPASVYAYFEEICAIPHGSGNIRAISDYLVSFAKKQGLRYVQDDCGNVILFQEGTCGYEEHAPVILQGHMDMVCQKEADCPIDMQSQGLDVTCEDGFVFAKGTTLGADDGIAVAYALAILADKTIPHPPLEVVITVDEETGMLGAEKIDLSCLKGRRLINIDSEDEGTFTVSCAGGARAEISFPVTRQPVYGPCVQLTVDGLRGGHSGVEIQKNLANANKVMGQLLDRIQSCMPIRLTAFSGGDKDNAIPRSCRATLVVLGLEPEKINEIAAQLQEQIRTQYDEPDATVSGENVEALGGNALTQEQTQTVITLLCDAPNGVLKMSEDIPGLVQTSLNLGIAALDSQMCCIFCVRSNRGAEKDELLQKLQALAERVGGQYAQYGTYPAWEYRKDSPLRDTMVRVFSKMYGKDPEVVAIHAGLECGLLGEKLPGLDCVSMGPDLLDIHTTRERFSVESVNRTWQYLLALLKEL